MERNITKYIYIAYMYVTELLCLVAVINMKLQTNYTSIKNLKSFILCACIAYIFLKKHVLKEIKIRLKH